MEDSSQPGLVAVTRSLWPGMGASRHVIATCVYASVKPSRFSANSSSDWPGPWDHLVLATCVAEGEHGLSFIACSARVGVGVARMGEQCAKVLTMRRCHFAFLSLTSSIASKFGICGVASVAELATMGESWTAQPTEASCTTAL